MIDGEPAARRVTLTGEHYDEWLRLAEQRDRLAAALREFGHDKNERAEWHAYLCIAGHYAGEHACEWHCEQARAALADVPDGDAALKRAAFDCPIHGRETQVFCWRAAELLAARDMPADHARRRDEAYRAVVEELERVHVVACEGTWPTPCTPENCGIQRALALARQVEEA